MKAAKITVTALILIGPMLELDRAKKSRLYDRDYSHKFRREKRRAT
jgi:precorrin-4 methylase